MYTIDIYDTRRQRWLTDIVRDLLIFIYISDELNFDKSRVFRQNGNYEVFLTCYFITVLVYVNIVLKVHIRKIKKLEV